MKNLSLERSANDSLMKIRMILVGAVILGLTGCVTTAPAAKPVAVKYEIHFAAKAYDIKDVDKPPLERYDPLPIYPLAFAKAGIPGTAFMEFIVDENGKTTEVQVREATDATFAESAKEALSHWVFRPAIKDGRPVSCRLSFPIEFNISD